MTHRPGAGYIATHMKTTIDIADPLLEQARQAAADQGTTLRALVERGLRHVLDEQQQRSRPFRLRKASFRGRGLQPAVRDRSWEELRELSYGMPRG